MSVPYDVRTPTLCVGYQELMNYAPMDRNLLYLEITDGRNFVGGIRVLSRYGAGSYLQAPLPRYIPIASPPGERPQSIQLRIDRDWAVPGDFSPCLGLRFWDEEPLVDAATTESVDKLRYRIEALEGVIKEARSDARSWAESVNRLREAVEAIPKPEPHRPNFWKRLWSRR